jgi:cellulose synthase/poly-beta-1,6-N-acetylglucosamine synthase-like glycosyltransferase
MTVVQSAFLLLLVIASIPTLVLAAEILSAVVGVVRKKAKQESRFAGSIAVLVPAHNESAGIAGTIKHIREQLRPQDMVLVVADNCSDNTASLARDSGATVVERQDPERRGKGYALAHGIEALAAREPQAVVFLDADCRASPGSFQTLANLALQTGRPVQALDLVRAPTGLEDRYAVAEFAWLVKNKARPMGLSLLGFPCQLMGTGMALPWPLAARTDFASGHLAEDLELGLKLAKAGSPPLFCMDACVESRFPSGSEGAESQRRRWEQGSVRMLLSKVVPYAWEAVKTRNIPLLALALDASVPPLVLHAALLVFLFLGSLLAASVTGTIPVWLSFGLCLVFGLSLILSWLKFGMAVLPPKRLVALPAFVLAKFGIWRRAETQWRRANRED